MFTQSREKVPHSPRNSAKTQPFGLDVTDSVLIVLAHPDDEFMIGEALRSLTNRGQNLHVAVLSDGTASELGDPTFVQSGRRREESIAALQTYGVQLDRQIYLGEPDGKLHQKPHVGRIANRLLNLCLEYDAVAVVTPGVIPTDCHKDHRAAFSASVAASVAMERFPNRLGPDVWSLSAAPGEELFFPDAAIKLGRIGLHASQATINPEDQNIATVPWYGQRVERLTYSRLQAYRDLLHREDYQRTLPLHHKHLASVILGAA